MTAHAGAPRDNPGLSRDSYQAAEDHKMPRSTTIFRRDRKRHLILANYPTRTAIRVDILRAKSNLSMTCYSSHSPR